MLKPKIYLDTSVISAYFDQRAPDRQRLTSAFWQGIHEYEVLISTVTLKEIGNTTSILLKKKMVDLVTEYEILEINDEVLTLASEYIKAGIIPERFENDALHIAIATVNGLDYLLSWNFEHIVKVKTKRRVNLINLSFGYKEIEIISPPEL